METRWIGKFEGISAMKRAGLPAIDTYKVEGKLLITSKIVQIM